MSLMSWIRLPSKSIRMLSGLRSACTTHLLLITSSVSAILWIKSLRTTDDWANDQQRQRCYMLYILSPWQNSPLTSKSSFDNGYFPTSYASQVSFDSSMTCNNRAIFLNLGFVSAKSYSYIYTSTRAELSFCPYTLGNYLTATCCPSTFVQSHTTAIPPFPSKLYLVKPRGHRSPKSNLSWSIMPHPFSLLIVDSLAATFRVVLGRDTDY